MTRIGCYYISPKKTQLKKKASLKLISQYIQQAIHTDVADGMQYINMKNVIKCVKSVKSSMLSC